MILKCNRSGILKASIFSDWNGKQFAPISQITDLVEVNNNGIHSSFFISESYLNTENQA